MIETRKRMGPIRRVYRAVVDSIRVTRAFSAASRKERKEALAILDKLGRHASANYDVYLLRGAIYTGLGMHEAAMPQLLSGARAVRANGRFSKAEVNYLIAYAIQYWQYSADQSGVRIVPQDVVDTLTLDGPIDVNVIPDRLRKSFPLNVELADIEQRPWVRSGRSTQDASR
jgi:hypothetical protein